MATQNATDVLAEANLTPVNEAELLNKFKAATTAEYNVQRAEQRKTEKNFYNNLYAGQQTVMDTLRKQNSAAVATGASQGVQAANQLAALLGLQQETVAGATDVANQAATIAKEETAQNLTDILTAAQEARAANTSIAEIINQANSVAVEGQKATAADQANLISKTELVATLKANGQDVLAKELDTALDENATADQVSFASDVANTLDSLQFSTETFDTFGKSDNKAQLTTTLQTLFNKYNIDQDAKAIVDSAYNVGHSSVFGRANKASAALQNSLSDILSQYLTK